MSVPLTVCNCIKFNWNSEHNMQLHYWYLSYNYQNCILWTFMAFFALKLCIDSLWKGGGVLIDLIVILLFLIEVFRFQLKLEFHGSKVFYLYPFNEENFVIGYIKAKMLSYSYIPKHYNDFLMCCVIRVLGRSPKFKTLITYKAKRKNILKAV